MSVSSPRGATGMHHILFVPPCGFWGLPLEQHQGVIMRKELQLWRLVRMGFDCWFGLISRFTCNCSKSVLQCVTNSLWEAWRKILNNILLHNILNNILILFWCSSVTFWNTSQQYSKCFSCGYPVFPAHSPVAFPHLPQLTVLVILTWQSGCVRHTGQINKKSVPEHNSGLICLCRPLIWT